MPGAYHTVRYNYAPHPLIPYANFQVHLRDDRVFNLEMFYDQRAPANKLLQQTVRRAASRKAASRLGRLRNKRDELWPHPARFFERVQDPGVGNPCRDAQCSTMSGQ